MRKTSSDSSSLTVRLKAERKQALVDAAALRQIGISDYVRAVTSHTHSAKSSVQRIGQFY